MTADIYLGIFKALKVVSYDRWLVYEALSLDVFLSELGEIPLKCHAYKQVVLSVFW